LKEGIILIAKLDRDGCISCGLCPETCPEVFRMADDGVAEVWNEKVPEDAEESAKEAEEGCPVSVISVE
jgi:Ferredoxin